MALPLGIEPSYSALQAVAMTTSAKAAWSARQESNLHVAELQSAA